MIKLQWKTALLFSVMATLVGCRQGNSVELQEPEGTVRISAVGVDESIVSTRLSTDDLSLRIENTRGEVLRTWEHLSQVPASVRVVSGSYKFVAWSGDTSLMPSFLDMYYVGESKFAVKAGQDTSVKIEVKVGVTKVNVEFDAKSFDSQYSSYSADLRTTTPSNPDARFLSFLPTTTDTANFMPGTLRIRMRLMSKEDGKEYLFYPSPITGLKAAEARTVTLKVTTVSGKNTLVVTTDDGYEKEEEITLQLPGSALPKPAPVIRPNNFTVGGLVEGFDGFIPSTKYAATIMAQGGIKSVKVRTSSPAIIEAWEGRNEIEMVAANNEMRNLLNSVGLVWDEALNSAETAAVKYGRTEISLARIFGGLSAIAGSEYTDYPFEIEVVDMFNQSNKSVLTMDGRFYFTVRVNKPDFGWIAPPTDGNVWSSHAEFDVKYMSNTVRVPKIWIKEDEGQWVCPDAQKFSGVEGEPTIGVMSVSGLKPQTRYTFRLAMSNHLSDEFSAVTETLAAVENGDMETWQAEQLSTSPHKIPYYQPYAKSGNQHWSTNNDRTTSYRAGIVTYGYNSFPAVSYTLKANNGQFAAELRNTSASDIDALNSTWTTQKHSQVAGHLFIGTFKYEKPNDIVAYGKPFASRPSTLTFYHTYEPYDSDSFDAQIIIYSGGQQIGTGKYVSSEKVGNYTQVTVNVTYTDRRQRADAMAIAFRSTITSPAAVRKVDDVALDMIGNMDYNKNWSVWIGSTLRLDDIAVGY